MRQGEYPGASFDASQIVEGLTHTLKVAMLARSGRGRVSLAPVIEVPNKQWAITEVGVECTETTYWIPFGRFDEQWSYHVGSKTWVDVDAFEEAFLIAEFLWKASNYGFVASDGAVPPSE